jgi:hypothetical protein
VRIRDSIAPRRLCAIRVLICLGCASFSGGNAPTTARLPDITPDAIAVSFGRFRVVAASEGATILGKRDAFVAAMGPLDRRLRLKSESTVTEKSYLIFAASEVAVWSPDEEAMLRRTVAALDAQVKARGLDLRRFAPPEVQLVKTTGAEEFGFPYTRQAAIVIPAPVMANATDVKLLAMLEHELFHVLSRHSEELRQRSYQLVGFEKGGETELPRELEALRLTNPDSYLNEYQLALPGNDEAISFLPVLYSKRAEYALAFGANVLDYAEIKLLAVERTEGVLRARRNAFGEAQFLETASTSYLSCIGRNSGEFVAADEVVASNFVRVLARTEADHPVEPTPALVDDLEALLRGNAVARRRCRF